MKSLALLTLAALSLAFAPAPFPRMSRPAPIDDRTKLQGNWVRTEDNIPLRVSGDLVHFPATNNSWRITLNQKTSPRRIDFVDSANSGLSYRGIYRLEGDTWTYRVKSGDRESDRPRDFDTPDPGAILRVNRRKSP